MGRGQRTVLVVLVWGQGWLPLEELHEATGPRRLETVSRCLARGIASTSKSHRGKMLCSMLPLVDSTPEPFVGETDIRAVFGRADG